MIEAQERGFDDPGEKYVCADCFDDYAIKEFIQNAAEAKRCDYCSSSGRKPIAALLETVLGFIMKGIRSEYGDPNNEGVGWEQGWVGASIFDKWDLLVNLDLQLHSVDLQNDIINAINIEEWCKIDPYGDWPHEANYHDWEFFSEHVKYNARYVFYKTAVRNEEYSLRDRPHPYEILEYIGKCADECELVNLLPKNKKIYRVRIHAHNESYGSAYELGTPPRDKAKYSNRMSPAGIPMFYGAFDSDTALKETYDPALEKKKTATIATFKTFKELNVLNLNNLPAIPSIFDEHKRHLRDPLIFLRNFVRDTARPIKKDGREHIEYVPTQIVTEYFKHIYKYQERDKIDGILYPSSTNESRTACVLFVENKNCIDSKVVSKVGHEDSKFILVLSNVRRIKL